MKQQNAIQFKMRQSIYKNAKIKSALNKVHDEKKIYTI